MVCIRIVTTEFCQTFRLDFTWELMAPLKQGQSKERFSVVTGLLKAML